jgi:CRP/FNR family transcriptional regulator, cyclic AMP receptor protein
MNPAELFSRDDDPVRLAPGQTLFREGETGDCMYVLLDGSADVFVGEILVESATPGALLGEMALVDSSPRTATVVATMPVRLANQRRFHFLVQQTPYFATHVMKVLAERLRHMNSMTRNQAVA